MASISSRLRRDLGRLAQDPPLDVTPLDMRSLDSISVHLEGPESTPFAGVHFEVMLSLPSQYPHEPPKAYFKTKIFHPNVDPQTGEVCVDTLKRDWSPHVDLNRVLLTIRCLLIQPNPDSSLNEEAGRLIQEDYGEFEKMAALISRVHGIKKLHEQPKIAGLRSNILKPINGQSSISNGKKTGLKRL